MKKEAIAAAFLQRSPLYLERNKCANARLHRRSVKKPAKPRRRPLCASALIIVYGIKAK